MRYQALDNYLLIFLSYRLELASEFPKENTLKSAFFVNKKSLKLATPVSMASIT